MKILYADWGSVCSIDIMEVLTDMGHNVKQISIENNLIDALVPKIFDVVDEELNKNQYDCVYTFNYIPSVSEACKVHDTKYICWVYDSPCQSLYFVNVLNECNYIFVFDSYTVEDLKKRGAKHIYYMPLGVNSKRMRKLQVGVKDWKEFATEVSFVGSLYMQECRNYFYLKETAPPQLLGYIDGVIDAQIKVHDYNFVDECLTDDIINELTSTIPCIISEFSLITPKYLFSNYYLYRRIANLERVESMFQLAQNHRTRLYTTNPKAKIGKCKVYPAVEYREVAPKVFRTSKVNMNISLRSIHTGIPLRALDIMSAGGFLVSNYQEDFLKHFELDKEVVLYKSQEEMLDKVNFYLSHEDERRKIMETARDKVLTEFDYRVLLNDIFQIVGL